MTPTTNREASAQLVEASRCAEHELLAVADEHHRRVRGGDALGEDADQPIEDLRDIAHADHLGLEAVERAELPLAREEEEAHRVHQRAIDRAMQDHPLRGFELGPALGDERHERLPERDVVDDELLDRIAGLEAVRGVARREVFRPRPELARHDLVGHVRHAVEQGRHAVAQQRLVEVAPHRLQAHVGHPPLHDRLALGADERGER